MDTSIEPIDTNTIRKEGLECEDATKEVKPTIQILHIPKNTGLFLFVLNIRNVLRLDDLGMEILRIAVPASLALAADPLASIIDTAFIGRLGSAEIAGVGISIAIYNQVSKVCIYPLVSVTTSFVAEEDAIISDPVDKEKMKDLEKAPPPLGAEELSPSDSELKKAWWYRIFTNKCTTGDVRKRKYIPSVSSALIVGAVLGLLQAITLAYSAKLVLNVMGVKSGSPMLPSAFRYLTLRSIGAPAVLLNLAMQGVFRGFKDTKTPLYATGTLLLARVIAVTCCVTLAASLAAHHGPDVMAAFQICLQLWLATSLLADGLAVAGQAILAGAFPRKDHNKIIGVTARVLQLSIILGMALTVFLGVAMEFGSVIFTKDKRVLSVIHRGIPFVAGMQTINSLAFVFDGINFGASDYRYCAYSMVFVAIASIPCLIYLSTYWGFIGIWFGLTVYMILRTLASTWRMGAARGPWIFLRKI
ncbi:protein DETOXIFICATION 42-like isoform X2 [Carex rostrata]